MKPERCTRCVLDTSVPDISFGEDGICNYCVTHAEIERQNPIGAEGHAALQRIVDSVKAMCSENAKYDCVIGVSGGTDSTYILYWAIKVGLRPLAVHFDNGWNSELAVRNIERATTKLGVDLVTTVVDWNEFRALQVAFLRASTPDSEGPSDMALRATLYRVAASERIKNILVGVNFRTEGKIPIFWSYVDGRYINAVRKAFNLPRFKTYPNFTILDYFRFGYLAGIKQIRPLWYLDYRKGAVKELLKSELGWEDYGGHHYESLYTRFNQGYYLRRKFGIDKRKVEFSALIRSGQLARDEALVRLQEEPYPVELQRQDCEYVRKKLGLTADEFDAIIAAPPKSFLDYGSYFRLLQKLRPLASLIFRRLYHTRPQILYYLDGTTVSPAANKPHKAVVTP